MLGAKLCSKEWASRWGNGRDVRFWLDDWVRVGPSCGLFPRLFRLAANKESYVSDCFEVRSGCNVWGVLFKRDLRSLEGELYEELLSFLANMFFYRDTKDSRILKPSISREFSTKAFYLTLEGNHTHLSPATHVWLGLVLPRVEVFCWLVVASKVATVDNLRKR